MEKFIIQYESKINGEDGWILYHSGISKTDKDNLSDNRAYQEHLTTDVRKALVFYEKSEAEQISKLFSNIFHRGSVIARPKKIK